MNRTGTRGGHRRTFAYCALALLLVTGCDRAEPEMACTDDALGVSRTLEITPDSPPVIDLLDAGEVVLSFDDGPGGAQTRKVLDELDRECTRASFFLVGRAAEETPALVRELVRRGHSLGGHSHDHANLMELDVVAATENARRGNAAISAATGGQEVRMFRFPYVATDERRSAAMRELGLSVIAVDADGADWTGISAHDSVERIMSRLDANGRKGVLLVHDPLPGSDLLTRRLLDRLKSEGYTVVALAPQAGNGPN